MTRLESRIEKSKIFHYEPHMVLYEKRPPIGYVTFNRPEKLNAGLNASKLFRDTLETADTDDEIRVIVIKGNGKSFQVGGDLKRDAELMKHPDLCDPSDLYWKFKEGMGHLYRLWDLRKPVVAQVHGYCIAGGFHVAITADITIASEDAIFAEPQATWGWMNQPILMLAAGLKKGRELYLLGDRLSAKEALELGLINRVVPRDKLEEEVNKVAARLAEMPPSTTQLIKRNCNRVIEMLGLRLLADYNNEIESILFAQQARGAYDKSQLMKAIGEGKNGGKDARTGGKKRS